jgi:uncharacterized membrane protein YagU involved in acid resistance
MARRLRTRDGIGRDLMKGAIAGAVATFVMSKVTGYMYEHEDRDARRREDDARGEASSPEAAAERVASAAGTALDRRQRRQYGSAIHWATGVGAGAVYAVLRRRLQFLGSAGGTAFGTAFWAFLDEGVVPALGLTPGPNAFPWQTHARGLVGHLTFGTVTDGTLRLLDRVA